MHQIEITVIKNSLKNEYSAHFFFQIKQPQIEKHFITEKNFSKLQILSEKHKKKLRNF
jgi:hypothetical protein